MDNKKCCGIDHQDFTVTEEERQRLIAENIIPENYDEEYEKWIKEILATPTIK